MRKPTISICTGIVMLTAASLPSATYAEPLAPGKPAGVKAAQMGDKEWLVFGGVGVLAADLAIANIGSGEHAAVTTQIPTVVNTTSTAI